MATGSIPKSNPSGAARDTSPVRSPASPPATATGDEARPASRDTSPVDRAELSGEATDLPTSDRASTLGAALNENFGLDGDESEITPGETVRARAEADPALDVDTSRDSARTGATQMSADDFDVVLGASQNYGELVSEYDPSTFPDTDEARLRLTERVGELAPQMTLEELRHAQGLGADVDDGLLEDRYRGVPGSLDASSTDLVAGLEHARTNGYLEDFQGGFADRFTALEEIEAGTPEYFEAQRNLRRDYTALEQADPRSAGLFEREFNRYRDRVGGIQPDFASVERPPLDDGNHHAPGTPEYRGGGEGHTSTRPENYRELYEQSIRDPRDTTRTDTFWAQDENGIFHRYSGEPTHWSGSTAEGRLRIDPNTISSEVRRSLEGRPSLRNSVGLPPPPDAPERTPGRLRPGQILNRAGGAIIAAGFVGASAADAAVNGEDVLDATGEATIDQIPGSYSVRQLADGRPEEATLGAIEEWPIVGTLLTEVARPALQGLGYDVDPSLLQMGLADGAADRLARIEQNGQLTDWLHEIGGTTDRRLGGIQFTSLPEATDGAESPQVHFRIGANGELERVNSADDPLGEFGSIIIGLDQGDGASREIGEEQARVAAALAEAYNLDRVAILQWSSDFGMNLEPIREARD